MLLLKTDNIDCVASYLCRPAAHIHPVYLGEDVYPTGDSCSGYMLVCCLE
jgi:hypothetical protein